MHFKKYTAEFVGTATLTLAVLASLQFTLPLATPLLAALTVGMFVYSIGPISGAHINPAVTVGLLSIGKIKPRDALFYIIAQCAGALLVMAVFRSIVGSLPMVNAQNTPLIFLAEAIGDFLLLFGICSVVHGKVEPAAAGLTIGGSLLLGISVAASASNGVLNPAVALGIGSVSLAYISGPLIGSVAACWLYRWMQD